MCRQCLNPHAKIVKKGFFKKKDARRVQRFRCLSCHKSFSTQTGTLTYRLRKTHLRNHIFRLISSGMSQRRIAFHLQIHHDTVARYLVRLSLAAAKANRRLNHSIKEVVFDEMEAFEHTKCKPITIVVAVADRSREILAMVAAPIPAKGRLAAISRKKYGRRANHRPWALRRAFHTLKALPKLERLKSDMSPHYPKAIRAEFFDRVEHKAFKGRRGCVVGQGELKRGGYDPLFYLNHTCAEVRDCVKRLSRRTWCTTKKVERLQMVLEIYQCFFNQKLAGVRRPELAMV